MDRFKADYGPDKYPEWYGGAYIDSSGWLVVQLVEDKDPADKSLELQVLDWTGSDQVMFSSCKYSLAQLKELMDQLNALPDKDMKCGDVMAGWGINEEANRIELTLTQVYDPILVVLAELDPDDDAIQVRVYSGVEDAPHQKGRRSCPLKSPERRPRPGANVDGSPAGNDASHLTRSPPPSSRGKGTARPIRPATSGNARH